MPIQMVRTAGGHSPVMVCDVCATPINDALDGRYRWRETSTDVGALEDVTFVHNRCLDANRSDVGQTRNDMELNLLLPQLAYILKVDWDKAQRQLMELTKRTD